MFDGLMDWWSSEDHEFTLEAVESAWEEAVDFWGIEISLSPPQSLETRRDGDRWPDHEPLAFIDLESRQVVVNYELLGRHDLEEALPAVFAHEIGHHIEYPRTLGLMAELEVMERRLLPTYDESLVNLFLDLQVNEAIGERWADEVVAVYERTAEGGSPLFSFYLAIYEELWGLESGRLVGHHTDTWLEKMYPGWRADARMFAQTFYGLPDTHLQFAYFCSVFSRYVRSPDGEETVERPEIPMGADVPQPSPADYSGALRSIEKGRPGEAIEEAEQRGWITAEEVDQAVEPDDTFGLIDELVEGGHGHGIAEFRRVLVEREYARLVDRHLFELPTTEESDPDRPLVPTTVEPWEFGQDPAGIDWVESVARHGPLAGAKPMRRVYESEEPPGRREGPTAIEIYLDTSGSMPDPSRALNAMTLAAQILSAAAIREEGRVRAAIYSSGAPLLTEWMYDEERARRQLLHFAGGGTDFPFDVLDRWSDDERDIVRVVISDRGFLRNLSEADEGPAILERAVSRSSPLVAMLAEWQMIRRRWSDMPTCFEGVAGSPDFRLLPVEDLAMLGAMAAQLADALFENER